MSFAARLAKGFPPDTKCQAGRTARAASFTFYYFTPVVRSGRCTWLKRSGCVDLFFVIIIIIVVVKLIVKVSVIVGELPPSAIYFKLEKYSIV